MASINKLLFFKIVAWYASIYHIILGAIGTLGPSDLVVKIASKVYGITPNASSQFLYMSKFISAYMIAFGLMLALLAYNPKKYKDFVWVAVALFVIRIFDRIVFYDLLREAFGSTMQQNLTTIVIAAVISILLIVLRPSEK